MRASLPFAFAFASLVAGCSGSVTGTGGPDPGTGQNRETGFDGADTTTDGTSSQGGAKLPTNENGNSDPGTSTPSEWDAMFEAPTSSKSTDNVITGLWAGSTYYADIRMQLTTGKITIAAKCGNQPATGLEVTAQVSFNTIKILASKSTGSPGSSCGLEVKPKSIPRCSETKDMECFTLEGSSLSFVAVWPFEAGGTGPDSAFTKLSD